MIYSILVILVKNATHMKNTTSRFVILIISVLCISFQPLFAQKLGKGFKYLEDNDYAKAMEYFSNAKNKGTELFATYYALSKLYSDSQSPYCKAEQALVTIKRAIAHKKTEKISEESIKKHYNFDFTDVDIQYNYALLLVLNNVDKIETITRLSKRDSTTITNTKFSKKKHTNALYKKIQLSHIQGFWIFSRILNL